MSTEEEERIGRKTIRRCLKKKRKDDDFRSRKSKRRNMKYLEHFENRFRILLE